MKSKINGAKSESSEARCWIENPQTQILRVELKDGSVHLCPYAWLVWVEFSAAETNDTVKLTFNSRTISITGKNLRELVLAFQRMIVECIKVQVERKSSTLSFETVTIESIQIQISENP